MPLKENKNSSFAFLCTEYPVTNGATAETTLLSLAPTTHGSVTLGNTFPPPDTAHLGSTEFRGNQSGPIRQNADLQFAQSVLRTDSHS